MLIHMSKHMATQRKPAKQAKQDKVLKVEKVQIPVFVTPEMRRSLKMTALDLDTTVGAIVEGLIRDYLAQRRTR